MNLERDARNGGRGNSKVSSSKSERDERVDQSAGNRYG